MIRHEIEQNTPEWMAVRSGRPTASGASSLITGLGEIPKATTRNAYAKQLAIEKFTGQSLDSWGGNASTRYGHEMEDEAASWYSFTYDVELMDGAFYTDNLMRWGASPDKVIGTDDDVKEVIELKNFPKLHADVLLYWHKHKRVMPERIAQAQAQMFTCECDVCRLVFYSPTGMLPRLVLTVERDEKYIATYKKQLELCLAKRDEYVDIFKSF